MKLEDEIKNKPFTDPFEKLMVNIIYTSNWLNYQHVQILKNFGVSPQQYNILRILRGQHPNPATVNLLKERMLDKMSNVSRLIEKLRQKGLVQREICPADRRAVDIKITEKGLDALQQMDQELQSLSKKLRNLETDEIEILNNLLDKLRG